MPWARPPTKNAAGTQTLATRNLNWTYDLAGNRQSEAEAAGASTSYSTTALNSFATGALNQYTAITGTRGEGTIKYDADGNLTQDGTWIYTYDGENRLKGASKTGQSLSFVYDYLGRRAAKTVDGTSSKFLWFGWKLAAQLANDGFTPQKTFVWGPDFSDAQGSAGGAGSLLAQLDTVVNYAIADVYGSIVGYLKNGAIAVGVEYSPFGKGVNTYPAAPATDYKNYPYRLQRSVYGLGDGIGILRAPLLRPKAWAIHQPRSD